MDEQDLSFELLTMSGEFGASYEEILAAALSNLRVLSSHRSRTAGANPTIASAAAADATAARVLDLMVLPAPAPPAPARAWSSRGEAQALVLGAARARTGPFSSRDLAGETGISAAAVGGHLAHVGWPRERALPGAPARWLPRGDPR